MTAFGGAYGLWLMAYRLGIQDVLDILEVLENVVVEIRFSSQTRISRESSRFGLIGLNMTIVPLY